MFKLIFQNFLSGVFQVGKWLIATLGFIFIYQKYDDWKSNRAIRKSIDQANQDQKKGVSEGESLESEWDENENNNQ